MAFDIVTGYKGEDHITARDEGALQAALSGPGDYVLTAGDQLAAALESAELLRIGDGEIMMQGRHIRTEAGTAEELAIAPGTAGCLRRDLVVCTYARSAETGIERAYLEVLTGTPARLDPSDPAYTTGDLREGALLHQMPLYRICLDGITVTAVEPIFTLLPGIAGLEAEAVLLEGDQRVGGSKVFTSALDARGGLMIGGKGFTLSGTAAQADDLSAEGLFALDSGAYAVAAGTSGAPSDSAGQMLVLRTGSALRIFAAFITDTGELYALTSTRGQETVWTKIGPQE